jgi:type VI secretion system protein ImpJ
MSARPSPSVLWREGMLLCPQHLQAFTREVNARIARVDAAGSPGRFGLVRFELDAQALERDVFKVDALEVLMRDGTCATLGGDAYLEQREFGEHFTGAELDVWLGAQAVQDNAPQVGDEAGRAFRYRTSVELVNDENLRDSAKELEFRSLHFRLFFGGEDRSGYESLQLARLVRRGKPAAKSALSESFVAPVVAAGASHALMHTLGSLAAQARGQSRDLALRVPSLARLSSADKGADISGIVKLLTLNQAVASLEQLAGRADLHPFPIYLELARCAGALALFGDERSAPELPLYDHAKLDDCFQAVFTALRTYLAAEVAVPYDTAEFKKDPQREGFFECRIPQEWRGGNALFYLAVEMDQTPEDAAQLVLAGVKLISPSDTDRVVQGVVPGIELEHLRTPPTAFPKRAQLHYFRVATEGRSRDSWLKILDAHKGVLLSALGALGEIRYHFYVELPG